MKSNFHKNVICVDVEPPLVEDAAGVQLFCVIVYLSICGFEYLCICIFVYLSICGFVHDFTGQQLPLCYQENSRRRRRCDQESHSGASNSSFRLPRLSKGHNRVRYKFNRHSSAGIYLRALHSIGGAAAPTFVKEVVLLRIGARGERER